MARGAPWNADWRGRTVEPGTRDVLDEGPVGWPTMPSTITGWSPHTGTVPTHALIPGYDPIQLQLVTLGELHDSRHNPWPAHGQAQEPEADLRYLYLEHESGIVPGAQLTSEPDPTMAFRAPPAYWQQTIPIIAMG